ncbi:MAG TPA: DUF2171 domain-containing protein [Ktedonobacteraceae bacterium]|jgi:hypothetical protein|nr:DUF2171 domain-containing protein [Ktedonobacteraceae bacterium]
MTQWNQSNVRLRMKVLSANAEHIGHIAGIYKDSFLIHKGYLFPIDRYIPYSAIASVEEDQVKLSLSSQQIEDALWEKRPDYEDHLGDPTQLFYDQGHGVNSPFDDSNVEHP